MSRDYWKLEEDLCRCCHSEGTFQNLAGAYNFDDEEEIYFNMLRETFDLNITPVSGSLCAATYTICDACITRLRDASSFKRQVIRCEQKFHQMYGGDFIRIAESDCKVEVKVEGPERDTENAEEFTQVVDEFADSLDSAHGDYHDDDDGESNTKTLKQDGKKKVKKTPQKAKTKAKPKKPPKKCGRPRKVQEVQHEGAAADDKADDSSEKPVTSKLEQLLTQGRADNNDQYYTLEMVQGLEQYSCNICKRVFMNLRSVKDHHRYFHLKLQPKLSACSRCGEKVAGHLRAAHLEQAHGVPAPTCGACGKKFNKPNQVLRHQKHFHMGEKSFKCHSCDMMFISKSYLKRHAIKHSTQREHKCEFCGKAFKWRKNLKTHIMIHLDNRRHACSVCDERFVQQASLKYHITKRHPEMV
ncbi:zinc finger protein 260-like isoform X4 [Manduca sexta]|uniref:zinc finger protein 260-like isoform X4 n=1 Tax=Manduca sexta TaxID=7130 RepID=UPI0018904AD1|nr:zinc finger protein 260-like isoform X4 [Manduca sexta]XP_037299027.1 zinc finger protein 260-like isoform X4 [Manduca sexta]